jgi:hypothetical protein
VKELVALAPDHWDIPWRNRQQVLSRLAVRGWRIVYSPGPLSWWERKSSFWATASVLGRFEERDKVSVFVPGRFPFRWPSATRWDEWVLDHHARMLAGRLSRPKESIVVLFHPTLWPLAVRLDPRKLVYYPFDNFRRIGGWTEELAATERAVVERATLIVASSRAIADDLPTQACGKVQVLGNGVDFGSVVEAAGPCRRLPGFLVRGWGTAASSIERSISRSSNRSRGSGQAGIGSLSAPSGDCRVKWTRIGVNIAKRWLAAVACLMCTSSASCRTLKSSPACITWT